MRSRLLLGLFIFTNSLCAQFSYTSADHFEIGSEVYYQVGNLVPPNTDFSTSGGNIEWNYSDVTTMQKDTLAFFDPNESGYKTSYCFANLFLFNCDSNFDDLTNLAVLGADTLGFGDFQTENLIRHYRKTDNKYEETMFGATILAGELAVPIAFDFSEPDVVLQFPFTYESKDSSISRLDVDLALTGFDAQLSRNRKRINSVDGYGSLQTSQGFYEDVLRMKTIIYNNDTTTLDSIVIPISTVEVDYKWFSKDHEGPVMVASGFVVNENEVITEVKIRDEGQSSSILALLTRKLLTFFQTLHVRMLPLN